MRTIVQDVYNKAKLSSFSSAEFNFVKKMIESNRGDSINGDIIAKFKYTTAKTDSKGLINGFTYSIPSNAPGLKDGKPTEKTTEWLIQNQNKLELSDAELSAIIRSRHGMDNVQQNPRNKGIVEWGSLSMGMTSVSGGGTSFNRNNLSMVGYVNAHDNGRKLLNYINGLLKERQRLIENGTLVPTEEEVLRRGLGGVLQSAGTDEVYVYHEGHPLAGQEFDFSSRLKNYITDDLGIDISRNANGKLNPFTSNVIGELDHLASSLKTRDPKDGTRVDENGNVDGGPTSEIARFVTVERDPNGRIILDAKGNPLYKETKYAKKFLGSAKKSIQYVTLGSLLINGTITTIGGSVYKAMHGFIHSVEHGSAKSLIYIKVLYGATKLIQGEADLYNNPVTPLIFHAVIRKIETEIIKAAGKKISIGMLGLTLTPAGWLEIAWIVGELGYYWYQIKQEEARKLEETEKMTKDATREAIQLGCLIQRYVQSYIQSNGQSPRCIPCEYSRKWDSLSQKYISVVEYPYDPTRFPQGGLPLAFERDNNGNLLTEEDPKNIFRRRPKVKRRVPKSDSSTKVEQNGTVSVQEARRRTTETDPIRGKGGVPIFRPSFKRDATSLGGRFGNCFTKDTLVSTPSGQKHIYELVVGDEVLSFDENCQVKTDTVLNTFVHANSDIYQYTLSDGSVLKATKNHPVLVNKTIFKELSEVNSEEFLTNQIGQNLYIIDVEYLGQDFSYNIEVKDNNTYIANEIFVHNKNLEFFDEVDNSSIGLDQQGTSIIVGTIYTHTATDEAEYNAYINAEYQDGTTSKYISDLMAVRLMNNNTSNSSTNAGPIISTGTFPLATADGLNLSNELEKISRRDRTIAERLDSMTLSLLYPAGNPNGNAGADGGSTLPPSDPNGGTPSAGGSGGTLSLDPNGLVTRSPSFLMNLGFDNLFVLGGWATIIPKYKKPSKQYGVDGIVAGF